MKRIGIIIKRKRLNSYENTAFRKEAGKLGINLDFIFIEDVSVKVTNEGVKIYYLSQTFNDYDFIFNRLGSGITNKESCIVDAISCVYKVYNNGPQPFYINEHYFEEYDRILYLNRLFPLVVVRTHLE